MTVQFNEAELRRIRLALGQLEEKIVKKNLRAAGRAAMTPVRDQVKANAPVDTGKLKIHVSMRASLKRDSLLVRVGIRGGSQANPTTPYYWRMVELSTRHMPARPFMLPALEGNQQKILDEFTRKLGESV